MRTLLLSFISSLCRKYPLYPKANGTELFTICYMSRYHHNAFFAQEVGVAVQREDMEKFKDYIQLMFDNQDSKYS